MANFEKTDIFEKSEFNREYINILLKDVIEIINNKGYNPKNQLMGYIKTNNPVYIPRDNGARDKITKISTDEILEFLLENFMKEK